MLLVLFWYTYILPLSFRSRLFFIWYLYTSFISILGPNASVIFSLFCQLYEFFFKAKQTYTQFCSREKYIVRSVAINYKYLIAFLNEYNVFKKETSFFWFSLVFFFGFFLWVFSLVLIAQLLSFFLSFFFNSSRCICDLSFGLCLFVVCVCASCMLGWNRYLVSIFQNAVCKADKYEYIFGANEWNLAQEENIIYKQNQNRNRYIWALKNQCE